MSFHRSKTWINIPNNLSISELLESGTRTVPPNKIIYEEAFTGRTITHGAFRQDVLRCAQWLRTGLGLQPGQIVTISGPSCIDYILLAHSVWWAGGVVSLVNDSLHVSEVSHGLEAVQPHYIFAGNDALRTKLTTAAAHHMPLRPAMTFAEVLSEVSRVPVSGMLSPFSLSDGNADKTLCAILLSSGTTGKPKAVMLSHRNMVAAIMQLRADNPANWRQSQREIFFPPLSHVYAVYVVITGAYWIGAYVCVMPRFQLDTFCRLLHERRATLARLVPPIAKRLADESAVVQKYTYPCLEYFSCSAAPLKPDIAAALRRAFPHVSLCQTYGATELSGPCNQSGVRDANKPLMAAGTIIANTDITFVNAEEGTASAVGPGEICVRGPNVMMGYKDDPKATAEALLAGGWYRTGDLGYLDENGYLYVYDRLKDIIKYNGFQVSPLELEELLVSHPLVDEAAVCGVWSDADATDLVRAYVVPANKAETRRHVEEHARTLSQYVADRVTTYKRLSGGVVFVDQLPKNPTGKVLRRALRGDVQGVLSKL